MVEVKNAFMYADNLHERCNSKELSKTNIDQLILIGDLTVFEQQ